MLFLAKPKNGGVQIRMLGWRSLATPGRSSHGSIWGVFLNVTSREQLFPELALQSETRGFWHLALPGPMAQDAVWSVSGNQCQAHSPYTLSCRVWVQTRPPVSTISTEKLPLSPDSRGPSSRLRLLCSCARPRKREWYRVSKEPRKNVARSSSDGQRDRQMASRTLKPGGCSAISSTEPPTLLSTWVWITAMGSAGRTETLVTPPGHFLSLACMQLIYSGVN
jgi:hypothetical protein